MCQMVREITKYLCLPSFCGTYWMVSLMWNNAILNFPANTPKIFQGLICQTLWGSLTQTVLRSYWRTHCSPCSSYESLLTKQLNVINVSFNIQHCSDIILTWGKYVPFIYFLCPTWRTLVEEPHSMCLASSACLVGAPSTISFVLHDKIYVSHNIYTHTHTIFETSQTRVRHTFVSFYILVCSLLSFSVLHVCSYM